MTWAVGDLAVCVDASPPRIIKELPEMPDCWAGLGKGKIYRVTQIKADVVDGTLIALVDDIAHVAGCADRFRKIEPAEPCFVEAMRNLKTPVDA